MLNSSVLWGLAGGAVFLLAIGFYRFLLPKITDEYRRWSIEASSRKAIEEQIPEIIKSVSPGAAIPTARTLSTAILVVAWPIFTFVLPFAGFFLPFLFIYVAYPLVWYFSGVFYKAELAEGRRNLLMASAPLLFLLVIGVVLLLISSLIGAIGK